ncbi:transposase [Bacillus sp. 349Y]|nr:transposase [Bacillus sp. 349Y]
MTKKRFTEKEMKQLSANPYVQSVSEKGITYTDDFKGLFMAEKKNGTFARQIFEDAGFDVEVVGMTRINAANKRWGAAYRKHGVSGLTDTRKDNSGRQREGEPSLEEQNARLEAKINLLQAEVELLKKIRFAERRLKK